MSGSGLPTSLSNQAFRQESATVPLAATDASASVAVDSQASQLQFYNSSSSPAFISFGDSTVVATAAGQPVAAGAIVGITPPRSYTHVAAILTTIAAVGTIYITPGTGLVNSSAGAGGGGGGGGGGDASAANQGTQIAIAAAGNVLTGAVTETAPATDTASSGLNGRLQRIAQRLTSLIGLLPTSLGAKTAATSFSVTTATDDSSVTLTGALTETAPATDTASSGLNGRLQRIAQRLTSLIALLPASLGTKTAAASLAVTTASDDALVTLTGALTETAPASDTASSGLNGRLQRIAQRLTSLIALVPASLGQKAMAASFAVTVASDQSNVPVNIAAGGVTSGTAGTPSADVITVQSATSNRWSYAAAAGGLVTTGGVTAKAAGGGSVRNYITGVDVINSHQTIGTEILIRDGAGGTVLHRGWAQFAGGGYARSFDPPLQGTANTLVEIAEVTATATAGVLVNLQGFTGT